jgi:5-methyltetrahydrofolate--homocysteine methyltransferase
VKGDVHDIGKNLVDIILSNNGYRVVNLGIKQPSDSIIGAAREHNADAIGLSGLLVKSTLEMKYVIQDLEQQKLSFPVICGVAALTRKYVEDDLRRETSNAVFYADDAFGGLHIMQDLTSPNGGRDARLSEGRTVKQYAKGAAAAAAAMSDAPPVASPIVSPVSELPHAPFYGARVLKNFDLRQIFPFVNELALFKNQWQLKTASAGDYKRLVEEKFRPIFLQLQQEVIANGWFEPKVVYGYYACQSEGNDVILYDTPDLVLAKEIQRFTFPRQREGRKLCIADFFAARTSGRMDVIGVSVVSIGSRASQVTKELFEKGDYTRYLYLHGLSVETAEALAEYHHKKMREELGIAVDDAERISDLFHQKYRGSRYSFGYPACPNLEDQAKIFALLHPEETIGVRLTSGYQLEPEQSTSAIVVHHPQAKYFMIN